MDGDNEKDEVSQEELEKALDTALETMNKAATKKAPPVPVDEEDEEDEKEEKEGYVKKSEAKKSEGEEDVDFLELSKSLEEGVHEKDENAQEVIDAVPFVKALMDTQEEQLTEVIKAIVYVSDKVDQIGGKLEKSEAINAAQAKLIKSMSENMRAIGNTPLTRKSVLGQGLEIIKKSGDEAGKKSICQKQMHLIN